MPAGFAVQLQLTPAGRDNSQNLIVIALRGSRTWDEWFDDTDAFPVAYANEGLLSAGLGSVHAGFYGLYTIGENGAQASGNSLDPNVSQRASGSIGSQIGSYVNSLPGGLSSYVTGHSLGAALASLCALDIAHNFLSSFQVAEGSGARGRACRADERFRHRRCGTRRSSSPERGIKVEFEPSGKRTAAWRGLL